MTEELTATDDEHGSWVGHSYTTKLARATAGDVATLQRSLERAGLGSTDPNVVRIAANLANARQFQETLEGKRK